MGRALFVTKNESRACSSYALACHAYINVESCLIERSYSMSNIASSAKTSSQQADIVLEGGGVRGIGHIGALSVLEERGYRWVNIAGTSAGALVAAMMAANYSSGEMNQIMRDEVDFRRFAQDKGLDS